LLVLWHNRQTEAGLVLRPKPRNRRGPNHQTRVAGFEAQTGKPSTTGFEAKPGETVATSFEAKLEKTVAVGFEAKPLETVELVLRPNHSQTIDLHFEAQPRNPRS
jgi:hypothetical protein